MGNKDTKCNGAFTAAGAAVTLKTYELKDQAFFLPFFKAQSSAKIKQEKSIQHVIYNNILYILIGESEVTIERPCFGDSEERYLDDKTPEPTFKGIIVLNNSIFKTGTDSSVGGNNYLENSTIDTAGYGLGLHDATCLNSMIYGQFLVLQNAQLYNVSLDAENVIVKDSRVHESSIFSRNTIAIHNSPNLYNIKIGWSGVRDKRPLNEIKIDVSEALFAEDNMVNAMFIGLPENKTLNITIESRIDFSPINAITGQRFSTARVGEEGIIVGPMFIPKPSRTMYSSNDKLRDDCVPLLFNRVQDYFDLKPGDKIIVNDFVSSIESRLQVYDYYNHTLK